MEESSPIVNPDCFFNSSMLIGSWLSNFAQLGIVFIIYRQDCLVIR